MLTLYSYPELFGVADNNPYGLKIFAFLKLTKLPFTHEHIFDAKAAPRGQLPYIDDDGQHVGDSDAIIAHLIGKHHLTIDSALTLGTVSATTGYSGASGSRLGERSAITLIFPDLISGCTA